MKKVYDVIVIGAGHAGIEAALAAARMGKSTLLTTLEKAGVALMPCNPAISGTAKGHLVREVDALGGQMGLSADEALLQIKMLNRGKGPAVFSLRGQADKALYHDIMLRVLENQKNLDVLYDETTKILVKDGVAHGITTLENGEIEGRAVVIATGVYYFTEWNNKRKRKAFAAGIYFLSILPEFVLLAGTFLAARGQDGYVHLVNVPQKVVFYGLASLAVLLSAIPLGFFDDKKICKEVRQELRERPRYWKRAIAVYWAVIVAMVVAANIVFPTFSDKTMPPENERTEVPQRWGITFHYVLP